MMESKLNSNTILDSRVYIYVCTKGPRRQSHDGVFCAPTVMIFSHLQCPSCCLLRETLALLFSSKKLNLLYLLLQAAQPHDKKIMFKATLNIEDIWGRAYFFTYCASEKPNALCLSWANIIPALHGGFRGLKGNSIFFIWVTVWTPPWDIVQRHKCIVSYKT